MSKWAWQSIFEAKNCRKEMKILLKMARNTLKNSPISCCSTSEIHHWNKAIQQVSIEYEIDLLWHRAKPLDPLYQCYRYFSISVAYTGTKFSSYRMWKDSVEDIYNAWYFLRRHAMILLYMMQYKTNADNIVHVREAIYSLTLWRHLYFFSIVYY
jgi:hypothetical protein